MSLARLGSWIKRQRVALASIVAGPLPPARADENAGWDFLVSGSGPADRNWSDLRQDLTDVLEAWRQNFLVRRITTITTGYVIGKDGIQVTSSRRPVERFARAFWGHKENRIRARLASWSDEIVRSGELFIALSAPDLKGMSYIRAIPASCIRQVHTIPSDYEHPTSFEELVPGQMEPKVWRSKHTGAPDEYILLHYAFSRVVGATRGEGDLGPVLPLCRRYTDWLKERHTTNVIRNRLAVADVLIEDDSKVEQKRRQYEANPPTGASIFVHGPGEQISFPSASINAWDAEPDGRAQRLAISAGSNYPLHFFGEGGTAARTTAKEMGGPTHAFLQMRQADLGEALVDLIETAYRRAAALGFERLPADDDLRLSYSAPDVSEADNLAFARAGAQVVQAFGRMRKFGWITDELAVKLSFKFFGELITEAEIQAILEWSAENEYIPGDDDGGDDEPAAEMDDGDDDGAEEQGR